MTGPEVPVITYRQLARRIRARSVHAVRWLVLALLLLLAAPLAERLGGWGRPTMFWCAACAIGGSLAAVFDIHKMVRQLVHPFLPDQPVPQEVRDDGGTAAAEDGGGV